MLYQAVCSVLLWVALSVCRLISVCVCVCVSPQLSTCLTSLIKTEKEAEVRRAAVHVITLLLRGLSHKTTQVWNHTHTPTHAHTHTQQAHGHRSARTYACTHTHTHNPTTHFGGVLSVIVQTGPRSPIVQVDHRGYSPRRHGVIVYTRSSGNHSVDRMKRK